MNHVMSPQTNQSIDRPRHSQAGSISSHLIQQGHKDRNNRQTRPDQTSQPNCPYPILSYPILINPLFLESDKILLLSLHLLRLSTQHPNPPIRTLTPLFHGLSCLLRRRPLRIRIRIPNNQRTILVYKLHSRHLTFLRRRRRSFRILLSCRCG